MKTSRQTELPGTTPDIAAMLKRRMAAPMKADIAQQRCESGLFGDSHRQTDLVEISKRKG